MKVLRVIHTMNPISGGPCQGIRNIVPLLQQYGITNEVLSMDEEGEVKSWNDAFTIHPIGHSSGPWGYNARLVSWLQENQRNYDLIIIHGLWLYNSFATAKTILKEEERPLLWIMPHGMLDPYFQQAEGRKLKALRNWIYWKLIEGGAANNADALLFTTQEELLLARTSFRPYKPRKELNVGYGVPLPPSYMVRLKGAFEQMLENELTQPYLLFLSRIHEKKGVDLLVKAYQSLKQYYVMPDLVIAGPGLDEAYGQCIEQMANNDPQIHFPGMLNGDAKWGAFYGCEALILPSHQENFGIVVAEALACAKPVLITNKVNIWREIDQGGAGLVADDTLESVYWQLDTWRELESEKRETMGLQARRTYEKYFSIEQAARNMKTAMEDAIKEQKI